MLGEGIELSPEDGFYTLKKDSQRRQTLTRVLSQDGKKICDVWLSSLKREVGQTSLTEPLLLTLMRGLRDFIPEQNKAAVEAAINTLRDEVDFDVVALNHIQLALYLFQDAVKLVYPNDEKTVGFIFLFYYVDNAGKCRLTDAQH